VARAELLGDAPGLTTFFETALGRRGVLSGVRAGHPPALADDLGMPVGIASQWLSLHHVTIACLGVPADVVAVAVLGVSGHTVGEALDLVRGQMPAGLASPSDEILASVAVDHAFAWRDLSQRRAEAVQRGESPWAVH
jgi:hypothetical protein